MSSCDARGDAGRSWLSGKFLPDPATPHAPRAVGSLGSRFWALMAEDSDSGDEGRAGSEQPTSESQGGSPRSPPTQRTLGDFLGPEWKVVAPAGRRRGGKHASFAPGGGGGDALGSLLGQRVLQISVPRLCRRPLIFRRSPRRRSLVRALLCRAVSSRWVCC
jgi:hypothetical protein